MPNCNLLQKLSIFLVVACLPILYPQPAEGSTFLSGLLKIIKAADRRVDRS
jgi:hypothetical protein